MSADEALFEERQAFRQPWLWGLLGLVALAVGADVAAGLSAGSLLGVIVFVGVALLLWVTSLTTQVRHDGIHVRFFPRHRSFQHIPWADLEAIESRTYRPIREFGGWGLRWRPGRVIYSVGGDQAVVIHRAGRHELWIGTRRPAEFVEAVDRARP